MVRETQKKETILSAKRKAKDLESVRKDLLNAIRVATTNGSEPASFAAGGVAQLTLPLLRVKGGGSDTTDIQVGMPVSSAQAELLVAMGEQAPHGRGEATVVDKSVRNAQRICPPHLAFDNPAWAQLVNKLAQGAKKELGVLQGVTAELHNLLVYSKGGHFSRHRDSEKCPGMFGTLIVSLPCAHRGGDLVLWHNDREKRFKTASDVPTQIQWFAFYADVEHQLLPVESGHRVVLVYNLVRTGHGEVPKPPPLKSAGALALRQVASTWGDGCLKVAHMLEHKYSEDGLTWDNLKGADATVVTALRDSDAYDLQLVNIKFTENGDDGDDYYGGKPEIHDSFLEVNGWHLDDEAEDLPNVIADAYIKDKELDESDFLQVRMVAANLRLKGQRRVNKGSDVGPDSHTHSALARFRLTDSEPGVPPPHRVSYQGENYFETQDPDDEEHEGPTGNEGAPMSRWYTAAAVILRPKKLRFAALGPATCAHLIKDALNGDAVALCGFATPQALYSACIEASGDAIFKGRKGPGATNAVLLALGMSASDPSEEERGGDDKRGELPEESARSFLHRIPASVLSGPRKGLASNPLETGLRAVLDKYGGDGDDRWGSAG
eukprot:999829-Prorocentrum_minimum.AAC.7